MMKRRIVAGSLAGLLMVPAMTANVFADGKVYDIKATFKDAKMQEYIQEKFDSNSDGKISGDEIEELSNIDCSGYGVESLDGLENFDVEFLIANDNKLTSIDVSAFKNLKELSFSNNQVTSIDVSKNTKLETLVFDENKVKSLDVSMLGELEELSFLSNEVTSIDVSKNAELEILRCGVNDISSIDVSKNLKLGTLQANQCKLTTIDVTNNDNLEWLYLQNNKLTSVETGKKTRLIHYYVSDNELTKIDLNIDSLVDFDCSNNKIKELDFSKIKNTTDLNIGSNPIENVDVSNLKALIKFEMPCTNIKELDLSNNKYITVLDISGNSGIRLDLSQIPLVRTLEAEGCGFDSIDFSNNPELKNVNVGNNNLTEIDLSVIPKVEDLKVNNNKLTSLDLSKVPALKNVEIQNNELTEVVIDNSHLNAINAYGNKLDTLDLTKSHCAGIKYEAKFIESALVITGGADVDSFRDPFYLENSDEVITNTFAIIADKGVKIVGIAYNLPSENGVASFAERLYTTCLGRPSEEEGKAYWIKSLGAGMTGAEAAKTFFFCPEFINAKYDDSEYVTRLYRTFMDREPDQAGLDYWTLNLKNGMAREEVFNGFIGSIEWADCCLESGILSGSTTKPSFTKTPSELATAFSERLYTTCLNRASDPEGLKYWANQLANMEITGAQAAAGFFFSEEFTNLKLDNKAFVERLYLTFMNREADADGMAYWKGELDRGCSREEVFINFSVADEFIDLCIKSGIVR